jgi:hypothetical protein
MNENGNGRKEVKAAGESGNTQTRNEPRRGGSTTVLWTAVVVLTAALVGATGYGYLALQKHNIQLSELPDMQESLDLLAERLDSTDKKFDQWDQQWNQMDTRVSKLNRKIAYNRELARTQAQKMIDEAQKKVDAQFGERDQANDARFRLLEAGQEAERARLAQVQEQIASVRQETGEELGLLHGQMRRGERSLDALARQLEHRRIDFELAKKNTRELAPGVSLRITKTNVRRQEVDGWLWLMPDRRTLWVRDLGLLQPLIFYHEDSEQPNELVITRVTKSSVIGYVLLPAGGEVTFGASADAAPRDPFAPSAVNVSESGAL